MIDFKFDFDEKEFVKDLSQQLIDQIEEALNKELKHKRFKVSIKNDKVNIDNLTEDEKIIAEKVLKKLFK